MSGEGAQGFEKLEVYRRGLALIPAMYALAQRFPAEEQRGLSDQMRRACRSVTANIAEGYGRRSTPKEFCRYLSFAVGSANEMEAHLDAARVLGYITEEESERYVGEYRIVGKQLTNLIKYWRGKDVYQRPHSTLHTPKGDQP